MNALMLISCVYWGKSKEIMLVKYLAQCLAHSRPSINDTYYLSDLIYICSTAFQPPLFSFSYTIPSLFLLCFSVHLYICLCACVHACMCTCMCVVCLDPVILFILCSYFLSFSLFPFSQSLELIQIFTLPPVFLPPHLSPTLLPFPI